MRSRGAGAEKTIVVQDHIRKAWKQELVTYALTFPQGACHPRSVTLRGPNGPVPCQLSPVELWPNSPHVKRARLSFVVDLAPLAKDAYVLSYGPKPVETGRGKPDLAVSPGKDFVEITTSRFGVRLLKGEKSYGKPVAPGGVPGPLVAMRRPNGAWFGGSRLYAKRKVAAYSARLVAEGPVFAEVSIRYTYADGGTLDLAAELPAGDSQVLWSMSSSAEFPNDGWDLLLSPGVDSLILHQVPWEFGVNTWGAERYKAIDVVLTKYAPGSLKGSADPLQGEYPPGVITKLDPWRDWYNDRTQTDWTFKTAKGEHVLRVERDDPGVWVKPAPPGTLPGPGRRNLKMIPLVRGKDGEIFMRVSTASGRRKWKMGRPGQAPGRRLHRVQIPRLNVVKDYVLDWPDDPKFRHPRLYMTRAEVEAMRRKRPADKELIERLLHWPATMTVPRDRTSWSASGMGAGALAAEAYLLTGSPEVARRGKAVAWLRHHLGLLGGFDLRRYPMSVVHAYDALIDSGLICPEERRVMRAQMAFLAYLLIDPGTWSGERGYNCGGWAFQVDYGLYPALIGCVIPGHPEARRWTQTGLITVRKLLYPQIGPAGEWPESSNYAQVSMSTFLPFAVVVRNAGFGDLLGEGPLKKVMLWIAHLYTPPDPRDGRGGKVHTPGLSCGVPYGKGGAQRIGLFGIMAAATAKSDPAYSRMMQWAWRRAGYPRGLKVSRGEGFAHAYMDPTLPEETPA